MAFTRVFRTFAGVLTFLAAGTQTMTAQQVRARVIDAGGRQPIVDARAVVVAASGDTIGSAASAADGFFAVRLPAAGRYRVLVDALGFATEQRDIVIAGDDALLPAFVLKRSAIPLDPVRAESERRAAEPTGVMARSSFLLSGRELANLERQSASMTAAVSSLGPLRVSTIPAFELPNGQRIKNYICVQSNRRLVTFQTVGAACDPVVLVVNGVAVGDPHEFMRSYRVVDFESIEYMTPVDAGVRYGLEASARGALVVWTRGSGPHRSPTRDGGS